MYKYNNYIDIIYYTLVCFITLWLTILLFLSGVILLFVCTTYALVDLINVDNSRELFVQVSRISKDRFNCKRTTLIRDFFG